MKATPISFRTEPALRDMLVKSSQARKISLTQEIERRLRESFGEETTQLRPDLLEKAEQAATARDIPLQQEIEERLALSFNEDHLLGGSSTALFTRAAAGVIATVEANRGAKWNEDRLTWEAARAGVLSVVEWFQPSLSDEVWEKHKAKFQELFRAAAEAEKVQKRIIGLQYAYDNIHDEPEKKYAHVAADYKGAFEERPGIFRRLYSALEEIEKGAMVEHREMSKPARKLGRRIANGQAYSLKRHADIVGLVRVFARDLKVEPAPSEWRDLYDFFEGREEEDLRELVRAVAGLVATKPDEGTSNGS